MIYLGAVEQGARTSDIGDGKAVFGEGAQDSARIVKEFEGLVVGVKDGHGNLQVLQSIDLYVWDRGLDAQARCSADSDDRNHEGGENGAEGGGHPNVGSEGWPDDYETLGLVEPGLNGLPALTTRRGSPGQWSVSDGRCKVYAKPQSDQDSWQFESDDSVADCECILHRASSGVERLYYDIDFARVVTGLSILSRVVSDADCIDRGAGYHFALKQKPNQ